jgi:hypothetical protein
VAEIFFITAEQCIALQMAKNLLGKMCQNMENFKSCSQGQQGRNPGTRPYLNLFLSSSSRVFDKSHSEKFKENFTMVRDIQN